MAAMSRDGVGQKVPAGPVTGTAGSDQGGRAPATSMSPAEAKPGGRARRDGSVAGIGFTVPILIATLAFGRGLCQEEAKLGSAQHHPRRVGRPLAAVPGHGPAVSLLPVPGRYTRRFAAETVDRLIAP